MNWKPKLAIVASAVLTVAAGGMLAAHAATPAPTPGNTAPKEPAESTTEATDPPEASGTTGTTGGTQTGHADANDQADHQFDGQE